MNASVVWLRRPGSCLNRFLLISTQNQRNCNIFRQNSKTTIVELKIKWLARTYTKIRWPQQLEFWKSHDMRENLASWKKSWKKLERWCDVPSSIARGFPLLLHSLRLRQATLFILQSTSSYLASKEIAPFPISHSTFLRRFISLPKCETNVLNWRETEPEVYPSQRREMRCNNWNWNSTSLTYFTVDWHLTGNCMDVQITLASALLPFSFL